MSSNEDNIVDSDDIDDPEVKPRTMLFQILDKYLGGRMEPYHGMAELINNFRDEAWKNQEPVVELEELKPSKSNSKAEKGIIDQKDVRSERSTVMQAKDGFSNTLLPKLS